MRYFGGLDYADDPKNLGYCVIGLDSNGGIEALTRVPDDVLVEKTGVDCPFGTSAGFIALYRGYLPTGDVKVRATEAWVRDTLRKYRSTLWWSAGSGPAKSGVYLNTSGHVKPTVGLEIVPGFLRWFYQHTEADASPAHRREAIRNARLGCGPCVESHPRAFLYSAVERVFRDVQPSRGDEHWLSLLSKVAMYRDKHSPKNRASTFAFLREYAPLWLWSGCKLSDRSAWVLENEHTFDAFLCALTAVALAENQTVTWEDAGLHQSGVETEGHIHILSQGQAARA